MSPQLITTVVGLALSVLVIGGGVMSMQQSGDAAKAKKLAVEVDSVTNASKTWMANASAANTFNGIDASKIASYVSGMTATGTGATSYLGSIAVATGQDGTNPVKLSVASETTTTTDDSVAVSIDNVPTAMQSILNTALTGKGCTAGAFASNKMAYTCKG